MKSIPTHGPDAFTLNLWASTLNKQAFRFYGNEIYDYGYCEPIGAGIHVYTVQLATLFVSKTVEINNVDGLKKYCYGQKQAAHYRAGYDAGRAWFRKNYTVTSVERYGPDGYQYLKRLHDLAFHKKTVFDVPGQWGKGVYGVKLLDVPIGRRALWWAGYYAAITTAIITQVQSHPAIFQHRETCVVILPEPEEIGRASCRERVCSTV